MSSVLYEAPDPPANWPVDVTPVLKIPIIPEICVDPFLFLAPLVEVCGDAKLAARMWAACDSIDMAIAMWHLAQYTDINVLILCRQHTDVIKAVMDATGVNHE